jgi:hypothetical protein
MKSGYYKFGIAIYLICFFTFSVYGQNDNVLDHISIKNNQIYMTKGGNVFVNLDIVFNGVKISSNKQLLLTPVVKDASNRLELPPVVVNGKSRANLYKRSLSLSGGKDRSHSVIKADKKALFTEIPYRTMIPYAPWMKKASVYLVQDLCGCGGGGEEYASVLVTNGIDSSGFRGNFTPAIKFITPQKEEIKKREEYGEAFIIFEISKWDILPRLFNNSRELEKIKSSLQYVVEEPSAQITSVSIKAYASPEASAEYNLTLSEKRANALSGYIQNLYPIQKSIFTANGMGEAWSDLEEIVSSDSSMVIERKSDVLRIIRNDSSPDEKERQLRNFAGGSPWNYLMHNVFPRLRRSDYRIEYTVPHYSIEEGKRILESKPNMLSLEEMYKIAYTYEEGSEPFNSVFMLAGKAFPKEKIAILNTAMANILAGNFQEAKTALTQYESDPDAWNSLGLVYMYLNEFELAQYYLEKAKERGDANAVENLLSLEKVKEQYRLYLMERSEIESE